MLTESNLHDYQSKAVQHILENDFCALFLDCGLGKTVITLTALAKLSDRFDIAKVLVVAPLRVVKSVWSQEAGQWGQCKHLTFSHITGTPAQRTQALQKKADIYLINYENISWLIKNQTFDFDTVVFDELSMMKSTKAKRFKDFKKVLPDVDRVIGLTGTPASNGLLDLYSQIFLLDKGQRLGRTYSGYRNRYFVSDYLGYNWSLRDGAEDQIYQKLEDICLSLSADDYLQLPDRIDNVIHLDFPEKTKKQYRELEKEFLLELEQDTVEVTSAAALTNKLLQFCNGAVYTTEGGWSNTHEIKLDALDDIIQEAVGQPVFVAYNYKSDLARIKERFPHAEHIGDSPDTIERWNSGQIPILLAHPASAGHGLNLQKGGNILVWFGLNWSLEKQIQFNARLHRQGQTKPVIIHHLAVTDSVDMTVLEALNGKHTTQKALLDALKKDITGRLAA